MKYEFSPKLGVAEITPSIFTDYRGEYVETWNVENYKVFKDLPPFKQDDVSVSTKNVLRGLHGDEKTWKLVQCLHGSIFLVVVDCRVSLNQDFIHNNNYGKYETFIINDQKRNQILVPPGFANGHLVLSDKAIFSYKQTTLYEGADKQFTINPFDPKIGILWPHQDTKQYILSIRDLHQPFTSKK